MSFAEKPQMKMNSLKKQKINIYFIPGSDKAFKGSDQLCKVVELSMQSCGKLLSDSFETC